MICASFFLMSEDEKAKAYLISFQGVKLPEHPRRSVAETWLYVPLSDFAVCSQTINNEPGEVIVWSLDSAIQKEEAADNCVDWGMPEYPNEVAMLLNRYFVPRYKEGHVTWMPVNKESGEGECRMIQLSADLLDRAYNLMSLYDDAVDDGWDDRAVMQFRRDANRLIEDVIEITKR